MKRFLFLFVMVMMAMSTVAQDCDALLLPYFQNDMTRLEKYKAMAPEKFDYRCAYVRSAFYESDTIPAGADLYQINSVKHAFSDEYLGNDFVVELYTLSYYAYNFKEFQLSYPTGDKVLCFSTPASTHPYLVLNSLEKTERLAIELWERERSR
ncbi:MAG: hypothetical protein ACSW8I_08865 [bacterium]